MPKLTLGLFVILVFFAIGIGCLFVIRHSILTGRVMTRKHISRADDSFEFWISMLMTAIFGGAFFAVGMSLLLRSL
jgi:uncharacterized membrane-anchored protein YitT (DUF2179 family)